jgi:antitoxin HigA-1
MLEQKMAPVHPGEVLQEEFLTPLGLSQHRLALDIGVDSRRINAIVSGKRNVTANTALRLAHYFKMSPEFWLGLQSQYDLDKEQDELGERIEKEVKVYAKVS